MKDTLTEPEMLLGQVEPGVMGLNKNKRPVECAYKAKTFI